MTAGKRLAGWCLATLGLMLGTRGPIQASPIQTPVTFNTIGSVDGFGVSGAPVVTFQGVSHGTMTTGSPFSLGQFQISAPPAGTSSTYLNIPFQIMFKTESLGGTPPSPNETPVILSGWLNGRISSADGSTVSESNLKAFFNTPVYTPEQFPPYPTSVLPFKTGNFTNYLSVTSPVDNSQPIQALMITAQTVPEPGSFAVFACIAGLAAWKARRRGQAAQSV